MSEEEVNFPNVLGTEWFNFDADGADENRTNCPKCEAIMCEDQAMSGVFELIRKNLGDKLNVKTFEVACWACNKCGYRQGYYQRYEAIK